MNLNGVEVITSVWLTESGEPVQVRRSWRERLFSRPWRPLRRTRTFVPQVPSKHAYRMGDRIVMHPAMLAQLKSASSTEGQQP